MLNYKYNYVLEICLIISVTRVVKQLNLNEVLEAVKIFI